MAKALQHPNYLAHSFRPIHRSNWTPGRQGQRPQYVVVHLMAGTYEGSISWAQQARSNVSWHYAISRTGLTAQNLGEHQTAWTNSSWWHNIRSVTLEHEGFLSHGGPTEAQLHASAKITAGICYRHGIPIDRAHIFGHTEIKGVSKPCPGPWPWARYMALVKRYRFGKSAPEPAQPSRPSTSRSAIREQAVAYRRVNTLATGPKNQQVGKAAVDALNAVGKARSAETLFARRIEPAGAIRYVSRMSAEAKKGQVISLVIGSQTKEHLSEKVDVIGTLEDTDILDCMGDSMSHTVEMVSWRLGSICDYLGFGGQEKSDCISDYKRATKNLT